MKQILRLFCLISILFNAAGAYASDNSPETSGEDTGQGICFGLEVQDNDPAVAEVLSRKLRSVIGRIGCGCENADYLILPALEVSDVRHTSGMVRNASVAKGSLTLEAVNTHNKERIWHSATIPLKAMVDEGETPAEALAKKINTSDAAFVRFVRLAKQKIAASESKEKEQEDL